MLEVNALAETLHEQRLGALEATALLRTVMEEIDVAVFAFDGDAALRLVNRAGERLLGAAGRAAARPHAPTELGLRRCLAATRRASWTSRSPAAPAAGRCAATTFRQGGLPHQLLVLTDVSRPLREEERQAWQRLIRVIGHELNNSLAPIKSIAGSLERCCARRARRRPTTGTTTCSAASR